MKKLLITLVLPTFYCAAFANCVEETIKTITRDGEYIVTKEGRLYKTIGTDNLDSLDWQTDIKVTVCGPKLIFYKGRERQYFTIFNPKVDEDVDVFRHE